MFPPEKGSDLAIAHLLGCASVHQSLSVQVAIGSIPSYVACCIFFVILCPSVGNFSQGSWCRRGWCRLEQLARHLAVEDPVPQGYHFVSC